MHANAETSIKFNLRSVTEQTKLLQLKNIKTGVIIQQYFSRQM